MSNSTTKAVQWLLHSNVLNKNAEYKYSTNNGYNWLTRSYGYIYHEITGYSISTNVYLYTKTKNIKYIQLAEAAAEYLLWVQRHQNNTTKTAFFHSFSLPDYKPSSYVYTFDNFIIIQGLADLYAVTGKECYLVAAKQAADWIMTTMIHPTNDGSLYARLDMSTNEKEYPSGKFPGDRGILQGKLSIAFFKLWKITNQSKYKNFAVQTLDYCLTLQEADGSFWANDKKEYVFSHAQCYVTEGLIYAAHTLKDARYLAAVERSLEFFRQRMDNGALRHIYKDTRVLRSALFSLFPLYTSDATSQYVRLVLLYTKITNQSEQNGFYQLLQAKQFLKSMQQSSQNTEIDGSFMHKKTSLLGYSIYSPIISTWCTQFSLQALLEIDSDEFFIENLY